MIKSNELSAALYFYKGITEYNLNNFDDAIDNFKKSIVINPDNPSPYYNLGIVYDKKGGLETAITYYKKAIAISPEYAKAYFYLGHVYAEKGDLNMENYYLEKAYQLDPSLRNKWFIVLLPSPPTIISTYSQQRLSPSLQRRQTSFLVGPDVE